MVDFISLIFQYQATLEIIIPFVLIFTVMFIAATQLPLFNKQQSTIIAIAIATVAVIPHVMGSYPPCWNVVNIINSALPRVGLIAVAMITFFSLMAIFGLLPKKGSSSLSLLAIGLLIFVAYSFITGGGPGCEIGFFDFSDLQNPFVGILDLLIPALIFGGIAWFIMRPVRRN